MDFRLHRYPFVRLTAWLIVGLLFGTYLPDVEPRVLALVLAGLMAIVLLMSSSGSLLLRARSGAILLVAVSVLGMLMQVSSRVTNHPDYFGRHIGAKNNCIFRIDAIKKNYRIASILEMDGYPRRGKLLLNYSESLEDLIEFDVAFAQLQIRAIEGPRNPKMFDFKKFQATKGIHYRAYLKNYELLSSDNASPLWRFIYAIKNYCMQKLDKIPTDNERAIAKALILGDKRDLDEDLRNAFADSGAMHVLAVSGLHVGVIYLIVSWLVGQFGTKSISRIIGGLVSLMLIWTFAMVAGGTASVCRAAFMISLLAIGRLLKRSAYPLNTLCAAAFFLLLFEPASLFDVGFQLSFSAVAGIIICHKPLEELWVIENSWGHKMWSMACVSLTATLFTLPLTIHYFHQFPLYSWLSGIVVVNGAVAILSSGLLYLVIGSIPLLEHLAYEVFYASLWLLNAFVDLFRKIPYVSVENIWLSSWELGVIVLAVVGVGFGFVTRSVNPIKYSLSILLIFSFAGLIFPKWFHPHAVATIYHIREHSYADCLMEGQGTMLNIDHLQNPSERYEVKNHHQYFGIQSLQDFLISTVHQQRWPFIKLLEKKLIRMEGEIDLAQEMPPVDIVWLGPEASILNLGKQQNSNVLFVIDGSFGRQRAKALNAQLEQQGLRVHDTWTDGALNWSGK